MPVINTNFIASGVPRKKIDSGKLQEFIEDSNTKRINFAGSHAHALKKNEKGEGGKIKLPFNDTIGPFIHNITGKNLFESQYGGYWRGLYTQEEFENFEAFVNEYKDIVFLRDHLDLSLALSMNFIEEERTEIGELEYQAKFKNNEEAEAELIEICNEWLEKLPFLKEADYICAMPGSSSATESLPHRIVNGLEGFEFENISDKIGWTSKTRSIKDAENLEEKLEILEESGLELAKDLDLSGKTVLLFDDLYMSGLSMQYVAMKLKEAGAARVFGLCVVKSRSNTAR